MNSVPKHPPFELLAKLKSNHQQFIDAGIMPYCCFDGHRHAMKKVARKEREKKHDAAKRWLEEFYDDAARNNRLIDEPRRESAMKYVREFTSPDELIVTHIIDWMKRDNAWCDCAPFEAEWQLVQAEKQKLIDAAATTDGDAVMLGAKMVFFDVDFQKKKFKVCQQEEVCRGNYPLSACSPDDWPVITSMIHLGTTWLRCFRCLGQIGEPRPETHFAWKSHLGA